MKQTAIEGDKTYNLSEIIKQGLLLNLYGKPYRSHNMVREFARRLGYRPVLIGTKNQLVWQIKGTDLILNNLKRKA